MTGIPLTATYRLQVHRGFGFGAVLARVEYFARLGISHLYLSPILAARTGSTHGYDIVDPTRLNPELGTEADFRALARALHERRMGLIVDIVPNHMGIGPENRFWDDLLMHGDRSRYARWFDVAWSAPDGSRVKLVLPVLEDPLEDVLQRGELSITLHERTSPRVAYRSQSFPLDPTSLPPDLQLAEVDPEEAGELANLPAGAGGRDRLRELLAMQHYRLTDWRQGSAQVNYRRFFDVNDLAALRVEDPVVFDETHRLVLRLAHEGVIDGFRIDHVDGLMDPCGYLHRLRAASPPGLPIVVEKILTDGERLRADWPVQGTTGYEFLNAVDAVLHDPDGVATIERCYRRQRRLGPVSYAEMTRRAKAQALSSSLRADVARVTTLLVRVARADGFTWSAAAIESALVAFLAALPVYRTYVDGPFTSDADRAAIEVGAATAAEAAGSEIAAFLTDLLLTVQESSGTAAADRLEAVQRLQQLATPAAAKGIEDTALYAYVPLVSRNEIGGGPGQSLAGAVDRLHESNADRAALWPVGLLATTTHDTKRSADVRARLAALSECPREWERVVQRWRRLNARHRRLVRGRVAPDTNTEYLIYQTLVALWPAPRQGRRVDDLPDRAWRAAIGERLTRYAVKAAREAKVRTSWIEPDAAYERALTDFVSAMLEPSDDAPFLADVARLVSRLAHAGARNALLRLVVHLTSPGTPDLYQGDELWNFTLVDPDNRSAVDYGARSTALCGLEPLARRLRAEPAVELFDDEVKLMVTSRLLQLRRRHPELFTRGGYERLAVRGPRSRHLVAFARCHGERWCLTVGARLTASMGSARPSEWWRDTVIELPLDFSKSPWTSEILSETILPGDDGLEVAKALEKLPVAVLVN